VQNLGYAPLNLGNLMVPSGFSLVGPFPTSIAAGSSAQFTLQLDTGYAGAKFGQVRFDTNDPDAPTFNFNLKGTVTGSAPSGAPVLTVSSTAMAYGFGQTPKLLDGQITLADNDSPAFLGGTLTVAVAAGGTADDRLSILNQGPYQGQIGLSGSTITFSGVDIGTYAGGTGVLPLTISLNANATQAAVQTLLQNIAFSNVQSLPNMAPRYVQYTLIDDLDKASNQPVKVVVVSPYRLVRTWDGGGSNFNWTTAANWAGDVKPSPGDDLLFPAGVARASNMNDYPLGTLFGAIVVSGGNYQIQNGPMQASSVAVQGSAALTVATIVCDTLSIGTSSSAAAGALAANSAYKLPANDEATFSAASSSVVGSEPLFAPTVIGSFAVPVASSPFAREMLAEAGFAARHLATKAVSSRSFEMTKRLKDLVYGDTADDLVRTGKRLSFVPIFDQNAHNLAGESLVRVYGRDAVIEPEETESLVSKHFGKRARLLAKAVDAFHADLMEAVDG
jgi:hypothetical protein